MNIITRLISSLMARLRHIGRIMAMVNSAVLLSLLYVVIISPIAMLRRLLETSLLRSKKDLSSLWTRRSNDTDPRKPF